MHSVTLRIGKVRSEQNVPEFGREIPSRAEASAGKRKQHDSSLAPCTLLRRSGGLWPRSHLFPDQEQPSVGQRWPHTPFVSRSRVGAAPGPRVWSRLGSISLRVGPRLRVPLPWRQPPNAVHTFPRKKILSHHRNGGSRQAAVTHAHGAREKHDPPLPFRSSGRGEPLWRLAMARGEGRALRLDSNCAFRCKYVEAGVKY